MYLQRSLGIVSLSNTRDMRRILFVVACLILLCSAAGCKRKHSGWWQLIAQGEHFSQAGDYEQALATLTRAIETCPSESLLFMAYLARAKVYLRQDLFDNTIEDCTKAIQIYPTISPEVYEIRGRAYALKGQYEEALKDYTSYIEMCPDDNSGYAMRGLLLGALGREEEALRDFDKTLEIKPDSPGAHWGRGKVYAAQGRYDAAIKDYDRALAMASDSINYLTSRGFAFEGMGLHEKALADYTRAKDLRPDKLRLYYELGWVRYNMGDFQAAYEDFRKAIVLASEQEGSTPVPYAHFFLNLSARRAGIAEGSEFQELPADSLKEKDRDWLEKLQDFFASRMTGDALIEAAESAEDERERKGHVCEACFYVGALHLLDGDTVGGRSLLERSVATNVFNYFEYISAKAELQRLSEETRDSAK